MSELLWSDPMDMNGRQPSKRGVACMFGPDVAAKFLDENNLSKWSQRRNPLFRVACKKSRGKVRWLRVPKGRQSNNSVLCSELLRLNGKQGGIYSFPRRRHGAKDNHLRPCRAPQSAPDGLRKAVGKHVVIFRNLIISAN